MRPWANSQPLFASDDPDLALLAKIACQFDGEAKEDDMSFSTPPPRGAKRS